MRYNFDLSWCNAVRCVSMMMFICKCCCLSVLDIDGHQRRQNSDQLWRRSFSIWLRVSRIRETPDSSIRSTQSSTSQRGEEERSMMNMRSDRSREHPGEKQHQTHQSTAVTSLQMYLDKTDPSEQCWQREWLALEKQSLCRSSFWTGLKKKPIKMSTSYFLSPSESWTWWQWKNSV